MEQLIRKKIVNIDSNAYKELLALPKDVQRRFVELMRILEVEGRLIKPDGKKLAGYDLFEMRVKYGIIWRGLYAYVGAKEIIVLSFFNKKSNKTPIRELNKTVNRLRKYLN